MLKGVITYLIEEGDLAATDTEIGEIVPATKAGIKILNLPNSTFMKVAGFLLESMTDFGRIIE